jgi:hypothetical protein
MSEMAIPPNKKAVLDIIDHFAQPHRRSRTRIRETNALSVATRSKYRPLAGVPRASRRKNIVMINKNSANM